MKALAFIIVVKCVIFSIVLIYLFNKGITIKIVPGAWSPFPLCSCNL